MVQVTPRFISVPVVVLLSFLSTTFTSTTTTTTVSAFGILPVVDHHATLELSSFLSNNDHHVLVQQLQQSWESTASTLSSSSSLLSSSSASSSSAAFAPLDAYRHQLAVHPIPTKMMTGATIALMGDAIGQSRDKSLPEYDKRRAASFMAFDACYRWLQHTVYPPMVERLTGGTIGAIAALLLGQQSALLSNDDVTTYFAVTEQTLCSQLVIVPLLYYPVFYIITGVLQRLTVEETLQRARETFVPLMKRNLLFWIPVQFFQFGFVEEELQVPFLAVCGLCWTIILSVMAGAARTNDAASEESREMAENYCVSGAEELCEIDDDDLFPRLFDDEGIKTEETFDAIVLNDDDNDSDGTGVITMEEELRALKNSTNMKEEDFVMN